MLLPPLPVLIFTLATVVYAGAALFALRGWRIAAARSAACFSAVCCGWSASLALHLNNPQAVLAAESVVILFYLAIASAYWLVAQRARLMKELPHLIARIATLSFWLLLWPVWDGTIPPAAGEQAFARLETLPGAGWMLILFALGLTVSVLTLMLVSLRHDMLTSTRDLLGNAGVLVPVIAIWIAIFAPELMVVSAVLMLAGAGLAIFTPVSGTPLAVEEPDIPLAKMATVETPGIHDS